MSGWLLLELLQTLLSVFGGQHFVVFGQRRLDQKMDVRIVVDDQYRQPPLRPSRYCLLDHFRAGGPSERVNHDVAALIGAKDMRSSRSVLCESDCLLLHL